ncbi:hypothetical protein U9M48_018012 [Paspalum notatum var. saurae]|uniref:Uncharacterized protein n=1 Tax=Paspalum notatum var. saurae TaxID=547442 RepID=A0AAQ3WQ52_PASNO
MVIQDCDDIGPFDRGEAVCHHNGGAADHYSVQCILNNALRFSIQGTGCLIKEYTQTMSNNKCGPFHHYPIQSLLNYPLRFHIQCTCCFIEQKYFWIFKDGSCYCNSLLLSSRKLCTALPNQCVVALFL